MLRTFRGRVCRLILERRERHVSHYGITKPIYVVTFNPLPPPLHYPHHADNRKQKLKLKLYLSRGAVSVSFLILSHYFVFTDASAAFGFSVFSTGGGGKWGK